MTEPMVACGTDHTLFLRRDGTVWGCGLNAKGQLGLGDTDARLVPVKIPIVNVKQVACGYLRSMFLLENGTVYSCGWNGNGELGLGDTRDRSIPTKLNITNVTKIVCGSYHNFFLKNDGTVWACGYNGYGELGTGNTVNGLAPIQIGIANVKEIICGAYATIAIKYNGTVWLCGNNSYGQFGYGDKIKRPNFVENPYMQGIQQISCSQHTLLIKQDGTVWGCGRNSFGQLGLGNVVDQPNLMKINISDVKQVVCAEEHSYFLKSDGSVWCCGHGGAGQLGFGTTSNLKQPSRMPISDVKAVAGGRGHTVVIREDGKAWGCGDRQALGLGDNGTALELVPLLIALELFYMLLKEGESYKTIANHSLQSVGLSELTVSAIKAHGFTLCSDLLDVWDVLNNQYELLYYHEGKINSAIRASHLPTPQIIMPVADIDVSAYSSIKQIILTTTGTNGVAKVVFSFDRGTTWRTYADGSWQVIALTNEAVATDGITPRALSSIPSEQWTAAVTGPVRVAYYLAKAAATDDLAVAQLTITGDTVSWIAADEENFQCSYPTTTTMQIKLLSDGSYKINYVEQK